MPTEVRRDELDSRPALIWRGALMVGASFFLVRFLRSEMPFCFSDMVRGSLTGEFYADGQCCLGRVRCVWRVRCVGSCGLCGGGRCDVRFPCDYTVVGGAVPPCV